MEKGSVGEEKRRREERFEEHARPRLCLGEGGAKRRAGKDGYRVIGCGGP